MSENKADAMSRLRSMANGDPKWDLSANDCAAIQMALDEIEQLRAQLRDGDRLIQYVLTYHPDIAAKAEAEDER